MLVTTISFMCFNNFLYNNSMQLSILIIKVILIELLLKLGKLNVFKMRHTEIFIFSGNFIKTYFSLERDSVQKYFV